VTDQDIREMRARAAVAKQPRKWCTNPRCATPGTGNGDVCRSKRWIFGGVRCDCACHVVDVRYLALDVEYLAQHVERQAQQITTLRAELERHRAGSATPADRATHDP
jgi:hypothetical protein